jgi:hypothetical protein
MNNMNNNIILTNKRNNMNHKNTNITTTTTNSSSNSSSSLVVMNHLDEKNIKNNIDNDHPNNHNNMNTTTTTNTSNNSNTTSSSSSNRIYQYRQQIGKFVNHPYIQGMIIVFITINALMLGLATCNFVKENSKVNYIFDSTDTIFLIIFTIELLLQFIYLGIYLLKDPWLIFDFILITSSWIFQDFTIIRSFRIFRTLRLITRISVMRNLVLALFSVIPRMIAIFLLLTLVSYIFAVMMTQLWKDLYIDGHTGDIDYFGRIDNTFLTLFQIMTLDAWSDVARQVMMVYTWGWLPIIFYIIIAGFVVVNLVIAVICDAVSALQEDDKAKLHGSYHESKNKTKDANNENNNNSTHDNVTSSANTIGTRNNATTQMIIANDIDTARSEQQPNPNQVVKTTTTTITNTDNTTNLSLYNDHDLLTIENEIHDFIQLQNKTIQHIVSLTQHYQKQRYDILVKQQPSQHQE